MNDGILAPYHGNIPGNSPAIPITFESMYLNMYIYLYTYVHVCIVELCRY